MKRKIISTLFILVILFTMCAIFFSCGQSKNNVESYYNLETEGNVYFEGEQTISIKQEEYSENKTTFKNTILVDDITISGVLVGKTIESVSYISETEISVKLGGKVVADKSHKEETGLITISETALNNGAKGNVLLYVNFEPKMAVTYNFAITGGKYVSEFALPYGEFISENVNLNNIKVPVDGVSVNVKITDEGSLRIEVLGFEPFEYEGVSYNYPAAKINANVTSFNKDVYVNIGEANFLGYDLN